MKRLLFSVSFIVLSFIFLTCEKTEEELGDLGRQAAIEFCDCYKEKSKNDCLDELKSNYSSTDYMNDRFITAFNQQSTCGIELEIEYTSY